MAPPPHVARANGMKGGRPPLAPNRLSRKRAMELCADKELPLDVMFDNMLFWHRRSKDLGASSRRSVPRSRTRTTGARR